MLAGTLSLSLLLAYAIAAPAPTSHVLHEKRSAEGTAAWLKRRSVPSGKSLPVRIGMTQSNLDHGHDLLMDISNPESANYGKYHTAEEIHELFAPQAETVAALQEWLKEHDITHASQSVNKQWLQFDVAVEKLEELLRTKFFEFEHSETGSVMPACDEYHVPAHLQQHIDYITPGVGLFTTKSKRSAPKNKNLIAHPILEGKPSTDVLAAAQTDPLASCDAITTSACVFALYNFTQGTTAFPGNHLGIFENELQFYKQSDLNDLWVSTASYVPKGTGPIIQGIDGGAEALKINAQSEYSYAGPEANLDFSAAIPLIYPQKTVLYQVDSYEEEAEDYDGFFTNLFNGIDGSYCHLSAYNVTGNTPGLDAMYPDPTPVYGYNHSLQCGVYKPANVISMSYGLFEMAFPTGYLQRACLEIMKLGLQGTTFVASSGDYGVAGNGGECMDNGAFAPTFPASCPYTLTVGSTYLPPGHSVYKDAEAPTTEFGSGGGFSNIFTTPAYQQNAVASYFKNHNPSYAYYSTSANSTYQGDGLYNRIGRGFPDVAAIGENQLTFIDGYSELYGGTSLSAPIWGSIMTRINEARLNAGKTTVGDVHQALYKNPGLFNDIKTGDNPGCGTYGFNATKGWDPVSGLGTPNAGKLIEYFLSLP